MDDFVMQKLSPKKWEPSDSEWLTRKDVQGDELLIPLKLADILYKKGDGSERFVPFLNQLIEDPFEKWVSFYKNTISGIVEIVLVYIAVYRVEKPGGDFALVLKCDRMEDRWVASDLFALTPEQGNIFRCGRLLYGRPEETTG